MDKEKCYTVYEHIFPDGKIYVGLTKQKPVKRWGYDGRGYKIQPIYDKICEFGWGNIQHIIVKDNLTLNEAQVLEQELICKNEESGVSCNIAKGGGAGGNTWVTYEYNGKIYTGKELVNISPLDNLTEHDISTRINHHGWNVEKAITQQKRKSPNKKIKV